MIVMAHLMAPQLAILSVLSISSGAHLTIIIHDIHTHIGFVLIHYTGVSVFGQLELPITGITNQWLFHEQQQQQLMIALIA